MDTQDQMEKSTGLVNTSEYDAAKGEGEVANTIDQDAADMHRLGKKQEFKRNFSFLSTLGFISIYMATWEFVLVSLGIGLVNGGFAGLFWMFIATAIAFSSVVVSLAEMESMAPTSGGAYHWVSEFAPASCQKFLSYSAGWMSSLGWIAGNASGVYITAGIAQSLAETTTADFVFSNWQYTLILLAFLLIAIQFNTWGASSLPMLQIVSLVGHLAGFFIFIIPLLVLCPKNSARDVFTNFYDGGGWGSIGTACLMAQASVLYCNLGSDSIVHISEETQNASFTVPRVMWWSYVLNAVMGIAMLITMLFCIGTLDDALNTNIPYFPLFQNMGSEALSITLQVILMILIFLGNITATATTSREVWAFSRDRGFPFSSWISEIEQRRHIPFNAVYVTTIVSAIFCLINLGSSFAFGIIISLILLALLSTYLLSIGSLIYRRLSNEPLPPARWSLGRYGLAINIFAFIYCSFAIVLACFPGSPNPDTTSANWAPAVWVAVIIISVIIYFVHGKRHFTPPVVFVEGKRVGALQESG